MKIILTKATKAPRLSETQIFFIIGERLKTFRPIRDLYLIGTFFLPISDPYGIMYFDHSIVPEGHNIGRNINHREF